MSESNPLPSEKMFQYKQSNREQDEASKHIWVKDRNLYVGKIINIEQYVAETLVFSISYNKFFSKQFVHTFVHI